MHHPPDRIITYHGLCYTSRETLGGTRNSFNGSTIRDRSVDLSHNEVSHEVAFGGDIAPNHMIARSEFEVHHQINKE